MDNNDVKILIGKTIKEINKSDDELIFKISDTESYKMWHEQDCCEDVEIDDICGELDWLIDNPILQAEERSNSDTSRFSHDSYFDQSFTWTFYELATIKGSVTIRWYGRSNGYYSERVSFTKIEKNDE